MFDMDDIKEIKEAKERVKNNPECFIDSISYYTNGSVSYTRHEKWPGRKKINKILITIKDDREKIWHHETLYDCKYKSEEEFKSSDEYKNALEKLNNALIRSIRVRYENHYDKFCETMNKLTEEEIEVYTRRMAIEKVHED